MVFRAVIKQFPSLLCAGRLLPTNFWGQGQGHSKRMKLAIRRAMQFEHSIACLHKICIRFAIKIKPITRRLNKVNIFTMHVDPFYERVCFMVRQH